MRRAGTLFLFMTLIILICHQPAAGEVKPPQKKFEWPRISVIGCEALPDNGESVIKSTGQRSMDGNPIRYYSLGGCHFSDKKITGMIRIMWYPQPGWAREHMKDQADTNFIPEVKKSDRMRVFAKKDYASAHVLHDERTQVYISIFAEAENQWAKKVESFDSKFREFDAEGHEIKKEKSWEYHWIEDRISSLMEELYAYARRVISGGKNLAPSTRIRFHPESIKGEFLTFDSHFKLRRPLGIRLLIEEGQENPAGGPMVWRPLFVRPEDPVRLRISLIDFPPLLSYFNEAYGVPEGTDLINDSLAIGDLLSGDGLWVDLRRMPHPSNPRFATNFISLDQDFLFKKLKESVRVPRPEILGVLRGYVRAELVKVEEGKESVVSSVEDDIKLTHVAEVEKVFKPKMPSSGVIISRPLSYTAENKTHVIMHQLKPEDIDNGSYVSSLPYRLLPEDMIWLGKDNAVRTRLLFDDQDVVWVVAGNPQLLEPKEFGWVHLYPGGSVPFGNIKMTAGKKMAISGGMTVVAIAGGAYYWVVGVFAKASAWMIEKLMEDDLKQGQKIGWYKMTIRSKIALDVGRDEARLYVLEGSVDLEDESRRKEAVTGGHLLHLGGSRDFESEGFEIVDLPDHIKRTIRLHGDQELVRMLGDAGTGEGVPDEEEEGTAGGEIQQEGTAGGEIQQEGTADEEIQQEGTDDRLSQSGRGGVSGGGGGGGGFAMRRTGLSEDQAVLAVFLFLADFVLLALIVLARSGRLPFHWRGNRRISATLHIQYSDGVRMIYAVNRKRTSIGRSSSSSLEIDDPEISSRHAEIMVTEAGFGIRDLGSRNGTFVNGVLVTESPLYLGDEIKIGSTRLIVES